MSAKSTKLRNRLERASFIESVHALFFGRQLGHFSVWLWAYALQSLGQDEDVHIGMRNRFSHLYDIGYLTIFVHVVALVAEPRNGYWVAEA